MRLPHTLSLVSGSPSADSDGAYDDPNDPLSLLERPAVFGCGGGGGSGGSGGIGGEEEKEDEGEGGCKGEASEERLVGAASLINVRQHYQASGTRTAPRPESDLASEHAAKC